MADTTALRARLESLRVAPEEPQPPPIDQESARKRLRSVRGPEVLDILDAEGNPIPVPEGYRVSRQTFIERDARGLVIKIIQIERT